MVSETIRINPADASEKLPEDESLGEWLPKTKAAARLEVSERTVESRISNGQLFSRLKDGKREVWFKHPKQDGNGSDQGAKPIGSGSETNFGSVRNISEATPKQASEHPPNAKCQECESKDGLIKMLENQLKEVEIAKAKLEGQIEGKDKLLAERQIVIDAHKDTIAAKDQAINAANAAIMISERNQEQAAIPATAESLQPEAQEHRRSWWQRMMGQK